MAARRNVIRLQQLLQRTVARTDRTVPAMELTQELWTDLLPRLKYVLSDCDGVLWHVNTPINGANDTFRELRKRGLKLGFVTNNSSRTKDQLAEKFHSLNFDVHPQEIFCVNNLTVQYLRSRNVTGRVYMIGTESLQTELEDAGFVCNAAGPDRLDGHWQSWLGMDIDDDVEAVVIGFDYHFSMSKVCRAVTYLQNPNCHFVAVEADRCIPNYTGSGVVLPSTGAILAAVEASANRRAVVIGKPTNTMGEMIRRVYPDLRPDNTLFIGDYLDTDIEFGLRNGFTTLLVETGIHNRKHISSTRPTFYTETVHDLFTFMS